MAYIVGFTGYAGAGKDTLATFVGDVLDAVDVPVKAVSFANPIREIANGLGFSPYVRETKETISEVMFPDFESALMEEIENQLSGLVAEDDLSQLFAFTLEELREQGCLVGDTLAISPRRLCQIIGTEGGRRVSERFWEDVLLNDVGDFEGVALVTDVRFPNESDVCDNVVYVERKGCAPVAAHESERHIESIGRKADSAVSNSGGLADLAMIADSIAGKIRDEVVSSVK